jgi:hypothetical protein
MLVRPSTPKLSGREDQVTGCLMLPSSSGTHPDPRIDRQQAAEIAGPCRDVGRGQIMAGGCYSWTWPPDAKVLKGDQSDETAEKTWTTEFSFTCNRSRYTDFEQSSMVSVSRDAIRCSKSNNGRAGRGRLPEVRESRLPGLV